MSTDTVDPVVRTRAPFRWALAVSGVVAVLLVVTFFVSQHDDDPSPYRTVQGVVGVVNPDATSICVDAGTRGRPAPMCAQNRLPRDQPLPKAGDRIVGVVADLPLRPGVTVTAWVQMSPAS